MKKTKKLCSFLLTAAFLITAVVTPSSALNQKQIITQDFESWTTADLKASHLNGSKMAAAVVSSEEDSVVTSGHALRFTSATAEEAQTANSNWLMGARITNTELKLGSTYRLTFKMYRKSAVGSDVSGFTLGQTDSTASADTYSCYAASKDGKFKNIFYYTNYQGANSDNWLQINQVWDGAQKKYVDIEFEAKAKYPVLIYQGKAGESLYIDNIVIAEIAPVVVDFYDGTEKVNQLKGLTGSVLDLPAAPAKDGFAFEGWYTDSACTNKFTATAFPEIKTKLYAKYTSTAKTYGFEVESLKNSENENIMTSANFVLNTTEKHSGEKALYFSGTVGGETGSASLSYLMAPNRCYPIEFEKGKTYELSCWIKKGDVESAVTDSQKTSTTITFLQMYTHNSWAGGIWDGNAVKNITTATLTNSSNSEWFQLKTTFSTASLSFDNTTYEDSYLVLRVTDFKYNFYLDDISIQEVATKTALETALESNMGYTGTAVRPANSTPTEGNNGQIAIRFKSCINENAIQNGIQVGNATYTVEEYGHLYFKNSYLNGKELTVESSYNSHTALKAVAYNKTDNTDIRFETKDGKVYFTLALYGIKTEQLVTDYVARPYIILKDTDGNKTTLYGAATQCASLAAVAEQAYYAQPDDIYNNAAAYTDTAGYQWSEPYTVRKGLYDSVLSVLTTQNGSYKYLAPAAAKQ